MRKNIFFGKSIQGRRRNNEDSFLTKEFDGDILVMAVADGMGGVEGGEIASSLIIKEITDYFNENESIKAEEIKNHLNSVFERAQNILSVKATEEPELRGLGSTLACLVFKRNKYAWANIGDSRIYNIRNNECALLTKDHTYQNELEAAGNTFMQDDYSHVLTKVIDGGHDVPDIFPNQDDFLTSDSRELFVMCSDGAILSKMNKDHSWLLNLAVNSDSPEDLSNSIIKFAYNAGSTDNITALVVSNGYYSGWFNKMKRKRSSSNITSYPIGKIKKAIILLTIGIAFISGWFIGRYTDYPTWIETLKSDTVTMQELKKDEIKEEQIEETVVEKNNYKEFEIVKDSILKSKLKGEIINPEKK